jgi:hypothetical protein
MPKYSISHKGKRDHYEDEDRKCEEHAAKASKSATGPVYGMKIRLPTIRPTI